MQSPMDQMTPKRITSKLTVSENVSNDGATIKRKSKKNKKQVKQASQTKVLALDVECVATGYGHDDRTAAWIAVVDEERRILVNERIKVENVVSYLTPLTSLSESDFNKHSKTHDEVIAMVKQHLGSNVILVGQSIENDIAWLSLQCGTDYKHYVDLATLFSVEKNHRVHKFSLAYEVNVLLNEAYDQNAPHSAVDDALNSMSLYKDFGQGKALKQAKHKLRQSKLRQISIAEGWDYKYEGVCLNSNKHCSCKLQQKIEVNDANDGKGSSEESTVLKDHSDDFDLICTQHPSTICEAKARGVFDPSENYEDDNNGNYGGKY